LDCKKKLYSKGESATLVYIPEAFITSENKLSWRCPTRISPRGFSGCGCGIDEEVRTEELRSSTIHGRPSPVILCTKVTSDERRADDKPDEELLEDPFGTPDLRSTYRRLTPISEV
jgi:hypothetical protein